MDFEYLPNRLEEKEVINIITSLKDSDIEPFSNLLLDPFKFVSPAVYEGVYIGTNILREEFGLEKGRKPGDIDIIIIPFDSEKFYFDRTAVFEVKVIRPNRQKTNKNSNSLGTKQIYGLLEDGFPLVGLLHVCTSEPLNNAETYLIKTFKHGVPYNGTITEDSWGDVPYDWLPSFSINNQFNRMISAGLPKYVGIKAFGINLKPDGYRFTYSYEYIGYQSGYFNPNKSLKTIQAIEEHFKKFGLEKYKRVLFRGSVIQEDND